MLTKYFGLVLLVSLFLVFEVPQCYSHGQHDHFHEEEMHERPSFKYSRQANENFDGKADGHGHSHGGHGHSHGEHEHDHGEHEHHYAHEHQPPHKVKEPKILDTSQLWLHAMGSTLLISAAPFFILFFVPLDNSERKKPLLNILLAFASGGLLGDAFLHLIPHAAMSVGHSHGHGHSHEGEESHSHDMTVGLLVLLGILAFLVIEMGVRMIKGGHTHSHSHSAPKPQKALKAKKEKSKDAKTKGAGDDTKESKTKDAEDDSKGSKKSKKAESETKSKKSAKKSQKDSSSDPDTETELISDEHEHEEHKDIKVAGYLNLAADFCHNFTDGLAIGSSYLSGSTIGIVTTFAILLHEVPHEIGDFAILLQSGVSKKNAMLLQLVTALGALAGTAISLIAQSTASSLAINSSIYILPFTAGGFIYIALVSVIHELLEDTNMSFFQSLLQVFAMLVGVGLMVFIAEFE